MLHYLLYHVSFLWNRLLRIPRSRGFGIQSPSAYAFLRDVINRHSTHFDYPVDLNTKTEFSSLVQKRRRLVCRLLLHLRPVHIILDAYCYPYFLDCGLHHAVCSSMDNFDFKISVPSKFFILDTAVLRDVCLYERILGSVDSNTLLVIFNIYRNSLNISIWNKLLQDSRTGVSFDLYDCGIIFFDLKKYKQNFKVNY